MNFHINFILLYLDPNSGSIIIQFFVAAVAGVVFYLGIIKQKIRSFFKIFHKEARKKDERS
jgi:hypothetical protein